MLISLSWLGELLPEMPRAALTAESVASTLTELGLEVESITRSGEGLERIVVGEVREKAPHPDADRLTCVTLFDGTAEVPVVCGASNLPAVGGKVAFAPVGARLPGGLEIAARAVRGQRSEGMICSEAELDIGPDGDGILVLDETWAAGARLVDLVPGAADVVLELGVTPNRPDALGHVGVARDLAVRMGTAVRLPAVSEPDPTQDVPLEEALVRNDAPDGCGRYLGFSLEGVTVGPSPLWVRTRLHRVGLRPINNVVDVTNVVLAEYGQPQHVFDRDQLEGGHLRIRRAAAEEAFEALDGQTLNLRAEDLVIADDARPQALAGVMGGADSMVSAGSQRCVLEVAWFEPGGVRRSARHHGLHTDSSHRFERQVDHGGMLDAAARRALSLLTSLAGATVVGRCEVGGATPEVPSITLRHQRLESLLGMSVPEAEVVRILEGLEVRCAPEGDATARVYRCVPPTFRPDLAIEVDLIEEVMRHHGLDTLDAESVKSLPAAPERGRDPVYERGDALVDAMCDVRFHEHVGFAFASADDLRTLGGEDAMRRAVEVANPLRSQHAYLRQSLIPSLLHATHGNRSQHSGTVRLFEVGRVYVWERRDSLNPVTGAVDGLLPVERLELACVHAGSGPHRAGAARAVAVDLRDALERAGWQARVAPVSATHAWLHPGVQACLEVRDGMQWVTVGQAGEVHPEICRAWDLPDRGEIFAGWVNVDRLPTARVPRYAALPRFPSTSRDVSIEVGEEVPAAVLVEALASAALAVTRHAGDGPGIGRTSAGEAAIAPVEAYRGEGVAPGRKAVLLRLSYRAEGRTVTDDEVQPVHESVVAGALERLEASGLQPARR